MIVNHTVTLYAVQGPVESEDSEESFSLGSGASRL